jgi:hypothetical protein
MAKWYLYQAFDGPEWTGKVGSREGQAWKEKEGGNA